jgi:hypothetical protein
MEGITSIGDYAFYGCTRLTGFSIPASVASIGQEAFLGCASLASLTISTGAAGIWLSALSGCKGIASLSIPRGVIDISLWADFFNSPNLENIAVDSTNSAYSSIDGVLFSKDKTTLVRYPTRKRWTSYTIPEGVTSIGDRAFSGCERLKNVTIPKSVTAIGKGAFSGCAGFICITIPKGVASIGDRAFSNCGELRSVTIPKSVTIIGEEAFSNCGELRSVTIPKSVTIIGDRAFSGYKYLMAIVSRRTSIGEDAFPCKTHTFDPVIIKGIIGAIIGAAIGGALTFIIAVFTPFGENLLAGYEGSAVDYIAVCAIVFAGLLAGGKIGWNIGCDAVY